MRLGYVCEGSTACVIEPRRNIDQGITRIYRFVEASARMSAPLDDPPVDFLILEAVEEALARYGKPDIFNTDQGSQFTSVDFTAVLKKAEIAISMDGKGAWRDNVFVERLWRSIKYEEVYLSAYKSVPEARAAIGRYLSFYNTRRPHSSLDRQTPDRAYFNALTPMMVAAYRGGNPLSKTPETVQTNRATSKPKTEAW